MDLNRLPNDEKLKLCKWYFKAGCAFLPFVWAVNATWFFQEAFMKPPFDEQKQIRRLVIWSGVGALCWAVVLALWVTLYQTQRATWGEAGERLAFILPLGRA